MRPVPPLCLLAHAAVLACTGVLACTAVLACATLPAAAATLRTTTTLHGPRVKLSDLFDDAGGNGARVLGPGPAPGGRIVVEAAQLAAIARQFNVEWRPSSSADRTVLDWPGRPLPRPAVMAALREALAASGVPPEHCEVDLADFTAPLVPFEAAPRPLVTELDYDRATGRFTAVLLVTGDGIEPISARIGGRVDELIEVPVATARLSAGIVLGPEDIHMARVRAGVANGAVARQPEDAIGLQLRHQIAAGQPLMLADLSRPELVLRGANVQMLLDSPGILLVAQGQAMESGAIGEHIRVLNPVSHAVIEAEVVGPDRVRVTPGPQSLLVAGRAVHQTETALIQ
jgi:flagella basal body P-ring formation protein FlgA